MTKHFLGKGGKPIVRKHANDIYKTIRRSKAGPSKPFRDFSVYERRDKHRQDPLDSYE